MGDEMDYNYGECYDCETHKARIAKLEDALREIVECDAGYHEAQFLARKALEE